MAGRIKVSPPEERTWEGVLFASKREMHEWIKLKALERAGIITNLQRQVRYKLHAVRPDGVKVPITSYYADFVFDDKDGRTTVADAKGHKTERYCLLSKWFAVEWYPLYILEL